MTDPSEPLPEPQSAGRPSAKRFHDDNGIPTPTTAAVVVIVVPFIIAAAMFAGFYLYLVGR